MKKRHSLKEYAVKEPTWNFTIRYPWGEQCQRLLAALQRIIDRRKYN